MDGRGLSTKTGGVMECVEPRADQSGMWSVIQSRRDELVDTGFE